VSRQTSHTIHAPFIFRRIRRTLRLRIERPDGAAPYEAVIKGTFMFGEIPVPGAKLSMMIDPLRPQHIEFASKTATSEANQPRVTRTQAGLRGLAPDITVQLGKLTTMHRSGDLTAQNSPPPRTDSSAPETNAQVVAPSESRRR
jgi:hypothetical protein